MNSGGCLYKLKRSAQRPKCLIAMILLAVSASPAFADITVVNYNLLHYDSTAVDRSAAFKTILNVIQPDLIITQEIANTSAVTQFLTEVLNAADGPGGGSGYAAADFTNTTDPLDNALFYRTSKITDLAGAGTYVIINTSPRDCYRWKLRPAADASGASDFYVYSMHLHSTDSTERANATAAVRADADALPAGTRFIYAGDFNIDSSGETSYQNLTASQADNDGRAFDPLNAPGTWTNNASFAYLHSQSPHDNNPGANGAAVGGGLDDRFDFLLISAPFNAGTGFAYLAGTYRAFGNDGNHFNDDINDSPVIPEGAAVADALHAASDHLPVVMELADIVSLPIMPILPSISFGSAIVGGLVERDLFIQNGATVPGQNLTYSLVYPVNGNFTGPTGPFVEPAGGGGNTHVVAMTTLTKGSKSGVTSVPNNSTNAPNRTVSMSGLVKDHAVPSTDPNSQILTPTIDFGAHWPGGFSDASLSVYNKGYTGTQAFFQSLLDLYASNLSGDPRFSLVGGFSPIQILEPPVQYTLHFNDAGAPLGLYQATLAFSCRDDQSLPGATNLPSISATLTATIGIRGDFNRNGFVQFDDISPFVSVLLDPPAAVSDDRWIADMNADTQNDARDAQGFTSAVGP